MELLLLLLIPLLGAAICAVLAPKYSARAAFAFTLINAAFTVYLLSHFNDAGGIQYEIDKPWLPAMGINFHLGADGINMLVILLANFLMPVIVLSAMDSRYERANSFFALMLFMQSGMLLVFTAMDGFMFYMGWEAALIPIYFICARWGGRNRVRVNVKFFIYTIAGSLLMLLGLIYLRYQNPAHNFDLRAFYSLNLSATEQAWLFWAFFAAFAVKMPIFPFHTWQPDTYTAAPAQGTMLLAGIMLKMGVYGVIKWLLPIVPLGYNKFAGMALFLCVTGIVYASVIAIQQSNAKRLVAYSSIAHVGLIGAGVFALNQLGIQGAMVQMLSHGINVIGLFLVIDIIYKRTGTLNINLLGGIATEAPTLSVLFLIILLGTIALPGTNGFIGEFLLLAGVFNYNIWAAVAAGTTVIFSAVYMFRLYQKTMLGPAGENVKDFRPLRVNEFLALAILCAGVLYIGIYPKHLQDLTAPAVSNLINQVNSKMMFVK